jgi:hypothetical protein
MLSKFVLLFGLLSSIVQVSQSQVVDCAAGKSVFQINSQGFGPNPPIVGENATLWIDYTVPEGINVDSGTAKYSFSLNGIPFSPTVEDLCTQIECPQVPGTYNISSASVWSGGISGKIVSKIQWYDAAGTELLCSQTTFRTGFPDVKKYLRSGKPVDYSSWTSSSSASDSSSSSSGSGSSSSSSSSSSGSSGSNSTSSSSSSSCGSTSGSPCSSDRTSSNNSGTQLTPYFRGRQIV